MPGPARVVAVVRDLDLGNPDTTLVHEPREPEMVEALAKEFNLSGPTERLLATLAAL